MTNDAELRRQALDMAIKVALPGEHPDRLAHTAEKFLAFLQPGTAAPAPKPEPTRWPKMGDTVIYCGAGFSPSPAIVTHAYSNTDKAGNRLISLYVLGTGGAFPKPNVPRGDWRFMAE